MRSMMNRGSGILLSGLLGIAALAPRAGATASTHIWAPSTDVQRFQILHLTSDLYLPVEQSAAGARLPSVTNLGLTLGVLPFRHLNLEIGVDHKTGYGALDAYPIYGNAKVGIPEGTFSRYFPALALGILDAGTKSGATDFNVVYGKLARTLGPAGRVSAGYFRGNSRLLLNGDGRKDNSGLMLAWERTMTGISDRLWLCLDIMGTNSAYGTLNLGGSWKFTDRMAVLAGYEIYNDGRVSPNTITIQADVDFDIGERR